MARKDAVKHRFELRDFLMADRAVEAERCAPVEDNSFDIEDPPLALGARDQSVQRSKAGKRGAKRLRMTQTDNLPSHLRTSAAAILTATTRTYGRHHGELLGPNVLGRTHLGPFPKQHGVSGGKSIVKDLVVGIDGSTTSWRALSMAVGIAERYKARVHACFVLHTPAVAEMAPFGLPVPETGEGDDGDELAQAVTEELDRAGVVGDFAYRKGDVAREPEDLAEASRADVIVVGRSRHPALHLGGVPRKLLAMGRRQIIVVP